jgi:hypothetical protein
MNWKLRGTRFAETQVAQGAQCALCRRHFPLPNPSQDGPATRSSSRLQLFLHAPMKATVVTVDIVIQGFDPFPSSFLAAVRVAVEVRRLQAS